MECPDRYFLNDDDECMHYIWPFSIKFIIGMIVLVFANGLATIAGVGGGVIGLAIFMMLLDYTAKDATIVVLCSIFAASTGNISNLMTKMMNGKPLIQYDLVFLVVPVMFSGSFIGILLNKFLPSLVICTLILALVAFNLKKTYVRFVDKYKK